MRIGLFVCLINVFGMSAELSLALDHQLVGVPGDHKHNQSADYCRYGDGQQIGPDDIKIE